MALVLAAAAGGMATSPALADDGWHGGHERHEWRGDRDWRRHGEHGWREHRVYYPYAYARPVYGYAPPPVVYVPPPVYAPPSVSFVFPLGR